jgi:1-acyl-sn-glycerol-3-phosphate acyltransferase
METPRSAPPKPISPIWRPDLTRLPPLNAPRRFLRTSLRLLALALVRGVMRPNFQGLQHLPRSGPALIATNHLGDADVALILAALPRPAEALGKIDLLTEYPLIWKLMDWYGMIWVHRGRVDRRALACAVEALHDGRYVVIAPEGRYTLASGLEKGGFGAAYVALHAGVDVIPMALTGTQNANVYGHLRRLKRPTVSLAAGEPLHFAGDDSRGSLRDATKQIMDAIARLLPPADRGAYGGRHGG